MMRTTLKDIKALAKSHNVVDITNITLEEAAALRKREGMFFDVAYSTGMYGVTGKVLQGHISGRLYVITARTSAIYLF